MFFIALFLFSQRRFDSKTERLHAPVRWTNVSTSIQSFWELKRKCSESWWPFEKLARREETRLSKMRHLKRWRRVIQSSDDTLTRSPIYHRLSFWFDKNKNPGDNSRQQIDKDPGIFLIRKKSVDLDMHFGTPYSLASVSLSLRRQSSVRSCSCWPRSHSATISESDVMMNPAASTKLEKEHVTLTLFQMKRWTGNDDSTSGLN